MPSIATATQPFLAKLDSAKKTDTGLFLFDRFLDKEESQKVFQILNSDDAFPWDLKPKLFGQWLPQHAFKFDRSKKNVICDSAALDTLDALCQRIEASFNVKIPIVYCNRFQDPAHHIQWHKDTYGQHIFVLSLGSSRRIEFRENKTKITEGIVPSSGDLYFMPLSINETHKHRVCAAETPAGADATRISFVFFCETPKYAKEYRITTKQRLQGMWDAFAS